MKKIFLLLSLIAIIVPYAYCHVNGDDALVVEPHVVDIGEVERLQKREFQVTLTNKSDKPIVISRIETSCGCIKIKWSKKPLVAGESRKIDCTYRSKDKGTFYKEVNILQNSGKMLVFRVKGSVK